MNSVDENVQKWYAEARERIAAEDHREALVLLDRILRRTNPVLRQETDSEIIEAYAGWPEELPSPEAVAEGEKPVRRVADYFTASVYLSGRCFIAMGERERGGEYLQQALWLWRRYLPLYREVAAVYCTLGDYQNALVTLQEALEIAPREARILTEIAYVYNELGRYREAQAAAARALELDPGLDPARQELQRAARQSEAVRSPE